MEVSIRWTIQRRRRQRAGGRDHWGPSGRGLQEYAGQPASNAQKYAAVMNFDALAASRTAAFSLRKLRTAYAGSCIKVRRSSDNTTSNIGFVAGVGGGSVLELKGR